MALYLWRLAGKETHMKEVDARGLQCPKPLMMAKKELDGGCESLVV